MAKGSEQKVRGLKWGNKRPDLIICDDLENDEIVLNKDRREKFRRWFYGALLPCRSDNGLVRVVGTVLHMDSLLERLLPEYQLATIRQHRQIVREELKEWTEYKLPWKSVKYRAHNQDYSKLLWKEKRSEEELKRIKADYVSQGMPDVYAQEYLNVPLDEANSFFKKADFKPFKEEDRERKKEFYITVDLAISEKDRADYTVFMIGGMDEDRILYVSNVIRDRLDGSQIVDTMIALQKAYEPVAFGVEEGQISKSIEPFLNEQMVHTGVYLNLYRLKPSVDKQTRARSIQARMRAGGCKFDKNSDWYQTMEDECLRFPRDKHDDQVDALAYLGQMVDKMVEAPTRQEQNDIDYNESFLQSGNTHAGRSSTTGY
jgi:predicted phage terminase large subunit-like protein